MHTSDITYDEADRFTVEGYMQLLNSRPLALMTTDDGSKPFKIGWVDVYNRFHPEYEFDGRIAAVKKFAELCVKWADR